MKAQDSNRNAGHWLRMSAVTILAIAAFTITPASANAQLIEEPSSTDEPTEDLFSEDALFGSDVIETEEESADAGVDDLLTSDGADVGGRFEMTIRANADPSAQEPKEDIDADYTLRPLVYIDSRPDPSFRVFLKAEIDYTTGTGDSSGDGATISVEELFADLSLADRVYFRAGKQNAGWGVGYYFSPADLLSLEAIDADDPEADREGPVAIRRHRTWSTANLYSYAILDDIPSSGKAGFAAKAELLVGNAELTTGGFYQDDSVSGAMATYSGGIRDIDLFAEAVLTYGSTITIVEADGPMLTTNDRAEEWFPSATTGFRYSWSDDNALFSMRAVGQYLYNGEGYEDPAVLHDERIAGLLATEALSASDLRGTGRHYGAASLRWSDALGSNFTASGLWIGNLSDRSGRASGELAYAANDWLTVSAGYAYSYGEERDEYTPSGPGGSVTVMATVRGSW